MTGSTSKTIHVRHSVVHVCSHTKTIDRNTLSKSATASQTLWAPPCKVGRPWAPSTIQMKPGPFSAWNYGGYGGWFVLDSLQTSSCLFLFSPFKSAFDLPFFGKVTTLLANLLRFTNFRCAAGLWGRPAAEAHAARHGHGALALAHADGTAPCRASVVGRG